MSALEFERGDQVSPTRRSCIRTIAMCALLVSAGATGQRTARIPRVALVFGAVPAAEMVGPEPTHPYARTFVHAMRDLGFVDGRNIIIEPRSAEAHPDRLPGLMRELVDLGVDGIVTTGPGVKAALDATDRIAIVGLIDDPVEAGLVDSLARPGRNLTGITDPLLHGKRLQLLKEAAPEITRVAVISYRPPPGPPVRWRSKFATEARAMGLSLVWVGVDTPEDLDPGFATIIRERVDGLYVTPTHVNYGYRQRIGDFALKQRLPAVGVSDGGLLLSYESDYLDQLRRAAALVKKILDGAKPADLPFEQPTKYSLVINLKTAKALGITIPQSLLIRADEVIQ